MTSDVSTVDLQQVEFELIGSVYPGFRNEDFSQTSVKLKFVFGAYFLFLGLYIMSHILASLTWTYRNLRTKEKIFWNLAIVRAVFGIFSGTVGAWAVFTTTILDVDRVFGKNQTSYIALCATVGFFIFECSAVLVSDFIYKSVSILLNIHHWLALIGYSCILFEEAGHTFGTKGLLLEMSTPFSALCWTLLKCGQEKSFLWKANQYLLVHTFHCRNVIEGYMWYMTYLSWDQISSSMPLGVFICLYTQLPIVTFVMTPYWTYKKTVQMINPVDWNFEKSSDVTKNGQAKKIV
ncbi:protein CLN8-like [Gigantopelta aegis]|uniref:protein CLN8-like n=1 Tax=Gigantopelta aegis TaxID=1735272 RepID=UPI001B887F96|nr:protein CLN8-like [Gigantopelta aegis]